MAKKYCSQLENIPSKDEYHLSDRFLCKITGNRCIASSYENSDPGHPASYEIADYNHHTAKDSCPAYDLSDELVKQITKFRLKAKKSGLKKEISKLEKKVAEVDEELK